MLLKALYDFAREKRLFETIHLQPRRVHLLIPLTAEGNLAGNGMLPLTSPDRTGKPVLGKELLMPRFPGENNGGKAYFLAESCSSVLGFETPSGEGLSLTGGSKSNSAKSFLYFWDQIEEAHKATALQELAALLSFRQRFLGEKDGRTVHSLPFIEILEDEKKKKKQKVISAQTLSGDWEPLEKLTLSFQVEGRPIFTPDPDHVLNQYWKDTYHRLAFAEDDDEGAGSSKRGLCIITEANDKIIARSHKPKILGVPKLTSGGYLVSFAREAPAFSSYGFEMGENAPVSEEAAASYALGLQSLLHNENNSLRVGPEVVCFWAKKMAEQAGFIASMLGRADPKAVADFLKSPWSGIDRDLAMKDQFYSVALSGNAGRVVVRQWMEVTVQQARDHLQKWFRDLEIVSLRLNAPAAPSAKVKKDAQDKKAELNPMSLYCLACTTVREAKNLRSEVVAQLCRAALEGIAPSMSLIKAILQEFRNALARNFYPFNLSRFALLKLLLNRNKRGNEPMIEPMVFETRDPAYNCGRLLAVIAEAQDRAHEFRLEGSGVAERYFGIASSSPSLVFPLLIRLNRHHLEKIKKSEKYGHHARFIEERIQMIIAQFSSLAAGQSPEFPRHLDLRAQGRFAIGFYQEKASVEAQRKAASKNSSKHPESTEGVSQ